MLSKLNKKSFLLYIKKLSKPIYNFQINMIGKILYILLNRQFVYLRNKGVEFIFRYFEN